MNVETIENLKKIIEHQEEVITTLKDVLVKAIAQKEADKVTFIPNSTTPWVGGGWTSATTITNNARPWSSYWTESTTTT